MNRREILGTAMRTKLHNPPIDKEFKCFICFETFKDKQEFIAFINGEEDCYDFETLEELSEDLGTILGNFICKDCFMENYDNKEVRSFASRVPKCDFCGEKERDIEICTWRYSKKDAKTINYCKYCYLDRKGGE